MSKQVARGGSFCSPVGAQAESTTGTPLVCSIADGQTRARWRANGPRVRRATPGTPGGGRKKPTILEMNRRQLLKAAKDAGVQLRRGEPDDDIRQKIQAANAQQGPKPVVDAHPVSPVTVAPEVPAPMTEPAPKPEPVPAATPETTPVPDPAPVKVQPGPLRRSPETIVPPNGDFDRDQGLVHYNSAIGRAWNDLGDDRHLEVDGHALGNVLTGLGQGITYGRHGSDHALSELRRIRQHVPDGTNAARHLDRAIKRLDAPERPEPTLPDNAPHQLRTLMKELNAIPLVRRGHDDGMSMSRDGNHETDMLADIAIRWSRGELRRNALESEIRGMLAIRHESSEGWTEIRRAVNKALTDVREWGRRPQ